MQWHLADDFTVVKRDDNGEVTEFRFSSHAQARQHVEEMTGATPPPRHKPHRADQARMKGRQAPASLTSDQRALKDEALKRFKGL